MNPDFIELIQRRLSGVLSDDESATLESALAADAELRRLYLDLASLDVALAAKAASDEATREMLTTPAWRARSWGSTWRPFAAAAAGLLIGLSGASLVYGIVSKRQAVPEIVLAEGFENESLEHDRGFPKRANVWSGDLRAPQGADPGVGPAEGRLMANLPPVDRRKFSYASRFMELSKLPAAEAGQTRRMEVTARFAAPSAGDADRFQIRLAAFAEDIPGAKAIWFGGHLDEQALTHVARTVRPKPDARGWTTVRSTIDLPAGAKLLLISLAAGVANDETPKTDHFLDDIQVRLITQETSSRTPAPKR